MSSNVVPFPSCGATRKNRQRRVKRPPPSRNVIKVVGLNLAIGQRKNALHHVGARYNRLNSPFDPADVRLVSPKLRREPTLGFPFLFAPFDQLHEGSPSYSGGGNGSKYAALSYLVNGHDDSEGAEYASVAYIYQMHPGNRIRQIRKAAGLTQAELADRTGYAQDRISNYENGRRPLRLAEMRVIARELGCSPADLLADDDNPERLSDQEKALLEAFRASSSDAQHFLLASAQAVSDQEDPQRTAA